MTLVNRELVGCIEQVVERIYKEIQQGTTKLLPKVSILQMNAVAQYTTRA